MDHVWPVNSLAFHPSFNTFASAGSDATVSIWDHKVKKRLRQYPKFQGGVAAVAFNCDGSRIAVGVSSTWDEGEDGFKAHPVIPWLGVRKVGDEVKVGAFFFFRFTFFLFSLSVFFIYIYTDDSLSFFCSSQNRRRETKKIFLCIIISLHQLCSSSIASASSVFRAVLLRLINGATISACSI